MKLPELVKTNASVNMLSTFAGYNRNYRIRAGEFEDMQNMTSDYYPVLSPRGRRGIVKQLVSCKGLYGSDKLVYISENKLFYNMSYVCDLDNEYAEAERKFVMMGAYLCVFPDKIMYNTYKFTVEQMENRVTTSDAPTITLCKQDGTVFPSTKTYTGNTEPDKDTYIYWIDTSENTVVMKTYSTNASAWVSVGTTYVKIEAAGIGIGFKQYDAAVLSGVDKGSKVYNGYDFNVSNILYGVADDYLIVVGFISQVFTNSRVITVKREVPDMDFVAELDNRIWGCSSQKHEIYACKQGDAKNWNCYMGIASDSYAVTVGTSGEFTGCVSYAGNIYFFKDAGYHRIYGSMPSNYELNWKEARGIQYGSERSIAVVNEVLYYKSREGICAFDGSIPRQVSGQFGTEMYYGAVAGGYRDKYYVCMRTEDYEYSIFAYDTSKGIWTKEDKKRARYFAYTDGGLYFVDDTDALFVINAEKIYTKWYPAMPAEDEHAYPKEGIYPGDVVLGNLEDIVEWSATSGEIGLDSPYNKYIRELVMRLVIDKNSYFKLEIMYDSSDVWESVIEYTATTKRSYSIPVSVKRCDHMKLRLSGRGDMKLYSMAQIVEEGSDVNVV